MQLTGMILVASWAIIGILSPVLAYVFDKLRGINDKDAMISTGRYDSRISAIQKPYSLCHCWGWVLF